MLPGSDLNKTRPSDDYASKKCAVSWLRFLILALMLAHAAVSAWNNGMTVDEPFFNGSGYPIVSRNDYSFLGIHPPLIMQLASLPLLLLHFNFPFDRIVHIGTSKGIDIAATGLRFLFTSGNDPYAILFIERTMVIFFALAMGIIIYRWCRALFDEESSLWALLIFSLCPNLIAHGSLFTTDLPSATLMFAAIFMLRRLLINPSFLRAFFTGLLLGLSLITKLSALMIIPVIIISLIIGLKSCEPWTRTANKIYNLVLILFFSLCLGQKTMMTMAGPIILSALMFNWGSSKKTSWSLTRYLLWICCWTIPALHAINLNKINAVVRLGIGAYLLIAFTAPHFKSFLSESLCRRIQYVAFVLVSAGFTILLGYTDFYHTVLGGKPFDHFIQAFHIVLNHNPSGHQACVPGSIVTCDAKYFFMLALFKIPILTLLLSTAGFVFFLTNKQLKTSDRYLITFTPLFIFIYISFFNHVFIGIRHALAIFPYLFIAVSAAVQFILKRSPYFARFVLIIGVAITTIHLGRFSFDYIPYFNEFIASPEIGARMTMDSNLNWGQDNKRLCQILTSKGIKDVKLSAIGATDEEFQYFGIKQQPITSEEYLRPTKGYYAIGLDRYRAIQNMQNSWLKGRKPDFKAGNTILVFEVF